MSKLRVAVCGAGILGSRHARVFAEQEESALVAVVDPDPARRAVAEKYGATFYDDLHALLAAETVDAVAVATPDHLHAGPVLLALAAGKHVFMEKPLATTVEDSRAIADAAGRSGLTVMVNFSQRFVTDHRWIKDAVDRGLIGRPQMVISVKFDTIYVPTGMIAGWSGQTSPIYFMSSHDLDLTAWFLGQQPVEVVAREARGTLDGLGFAVHDGLNALIAFDGGATGNFHSSWIHPNTYPKIADGHLQIIGSEGALTYNNRTRVAELHNASGGQRVEFTGPHTADEVGGRITGAFAESVREFIACVRAAREPETSPRRCLPVALAQAAALESARTGALVQVEVLRLA
jgi:predicted dehydrogenase